MRTELIILYLAGYYLGFLLFIFILHFIPGLHKEFIRKSYHVMCAFGNILIISILDNWVTALLIHFSIFGLAFIFITVFAKTRLVTSLYLDRNHGTKEIRKQIIFFILAFGLSVAFFWGYLGDMYKGVASLGFLLWGVGDAAAAIIGKLYGSTKLSNVSSLLNPQKSYQGSLGLIISTFLVAFCAIPRYIVLTDFWSSLPGLMLLSIIITLVAAVTESLSSHGSDTITFPLAVSFFTYLIAG